MARDTLDNLAKTLADTLPEGLRSMRADVERNFRAVLASGIDKLDLVTREEFEVQQAVLAKTRQKLAALEARLATLEVPKPRKKSAREAPSRKTTVKRPRPAKKPASR